ncbi:MAG: helix-hairpin-helix domain-containing protein [Myxococcota bacterium]
MKARLLIFCFLAVGFLPIRQAAAAPALLLTASVEGTLNLNTATERELMMLPGVGPATAAKVVAYRRRHKFTRPAHVMRIKGIGKKTYARLRPYLAVDGVTTLRPCGPPR